MPLQFICLLKSLSQMSLASLLTCFYLQICLSHLLNFPLWFPSLIKQTSLLLVCKLTQIQTFALSFSVSNLAFKYDNHLKNPLYYAKQSSSFRYLFVKYSRFGEHSFFFAGKSLYFSAPCLPLPILIF